jgi:tryptophan-rich sensory protein
LGSNLVGSIGAIFTSPQITAWYANVAKPSFNPPNWIFGPVWTLLFSLMGIAFYLIIRNGWSSRNVKIAVAIFAFQFALNVLWSFLFFGLENPFLAFIEIIFLWLLILATILAFYKVDKIAAYLLVPYILWVSFAAFLNYSIWILNR